MLKDNFYTVLSLKTEEETLHVKVKLNEEHEIFKGHFPSVPVVPGVCITHILTEILSEKLGHELMMSEGKQIKFLAVVNPKECLEMDYEITYSVSEEIDVTASATHNEKVCFKFKGVFTEK